MLKHTLIPKVFGTLAHRYAQRPGGYTRILKFGNRQGDNAPHAVLELVDNPRDLKFNMTARAVGWELVGNALRQSTNNVLTEGVTGVEEVIRREKSTEKAGFLHHGVGGRLRRVTHENLKKVLKYRGTSGVKELTMKAQEYIVCYFLLTPSRILDSYSLSESSRRRAVESRRYSGNFREEYGQYEKRRRRARLDCVRFFTSNPPICR